jgi:hypothetical protein
MAQLAPLGALTSSITLIEKSMALFRAVASARNFGADAAHLVMKLRFEAFRYAHWARNNQALLDTLSTDPPTDLQPVALAASVARTSPVISVQQALCDSVVQVIEVLEIIDKLLSKYGRAFESSPQDETKPESALRGLATVTATLNIDGFQLDVPQAMENYRQLKESLQAKTSLPRRFKYSIPTWNEADKETLNTMILRFKYWNDTLIEITRISEPSAQGMVELEVTSQIIGSAVSVEQLEIVQSAALESSYESMRRSAQVKMQKVNPKPTIQTMEKRYDEVYIPSKFTKSRRFMTKYTPSGKLERLKERYVLD